MPAGPIPPRDRQGNVSAASAIPGGVTAPGPGAGADDPAPSSSPSHCPGGGPSPAPGLFPFTLPQAAALARLMDREANWAAGALRAGMAPPRKSDRPDRPWRPLVSAVFLDAMDACEAAGLWAPEP